MNRENTLTVWAEVMVTKPVTYNEQWTKNDEQ
jgi:hypothetical protein